jgi:excinuclease ABC subunit A
VIEGSPNWNGKWNKQWYGMRRFFEYLESKAYKMHIRVLLSKYRSYTPCPAAAARGSRPRPAGAWAASDADAVLPAGSASCRRAWAGRARSWRPCRACACTT